MTNSTELKQIVSLATPKLEQALIETPFADNLPEQLQLRASNCGLATKAIELYLRDQHQIESKRLIHVSEDDNLRGINSRRQSHVILRAENGQFIDPTYSQFMSLVGLTPKVALENELEYLYPKDKVIEFNEQNVSQFTSQFAEHVYGTWQQYSNEIPEPIVADPRLSALRGASRAKIQSTYAGLWKLENYRELESDETPEGLASAAGSVALRMSELENR